MAVLLIIITVALYAVALYLWIRRRAYRYTVALLAGHLTAMFIPLWERLYSYSFAPTINDIMVWNRPVPLFMVIASSWLYALPALVLFYGHRWRWWPRHYITGVVAFVGLVLYHLIAQGIGLRSGLWSYNQPDLRWGIPYPLVLALLGALVSLLIGYILIATRHYAAEVLIPTLVGGVLAAPLLVYGILGVPYWLPVLLGQSTLIITLGLLVTAGMVTWVVHVACWGLHVSRKQHVRWGG